MEISKNGVTPKSSILMGFPMINHPAIGDPTMGIPAKHGAAKRRPHAHHGAHRGTELVLEPKLVGTRWEWVRN